MNERIGYPEFILDAAQLDKKYDGVSTRVSAPRCEGTTQELGGVGTYTRSSLQRIRILRALGYSEQFFAWKQELLIDINVKLAPIYELNNSL